MSNEQPTRDQVLSIINVQINERVKAFGQELVTFSEDYKRRVSLLGRDPAKVHPMMVFQAWSVNKLAALSVLLDNTMEALHALGSQAAVMSPAEEPETPAAAE